MQPKIELLLSTVHFTAEPRYSRDPMPQKPLEPSARPEKDRASRRGRVLVPILGVTYELHIIAKLIPVSKERISPDDLLGMPVPKRVM